MISAELSCGRDDWNVTVIEMGILLLHMRIAVILVR
jgi:hypothetical protein